MNFKVYSIPPFDKQLKKLSKKYPSLKEEYLQLVKLLEESPLRGISLGNNCYKFRLPIASKRKR